MTPSNRIVSYTLSLVCGLALICTACADPLEIRWPNNEKLAVSLSYDDALGSQLDNAVPVLDKFGFRVSFYIFPASESFRTRLNEWKTLAENGHELGNHTLHHNCSRKLSGNWVRPHVDIDKRTVEEMVMDIKIGNTLLQALDGKTERTFTPPCGHTETSDGDYLEAVKDEFVAIKGQGLQSGFSTLALPDGHTAGEMIKFVEDSGPKVKLVNIIFHGIGGDHISVDKKEHEKFIEYLAKNKDRYWVDTYLNIMKYAKAAENKSN